MDYQLPIEDVEIFEVPINFYNSLIEDIKRAEKLVYIEIYRITKESLGILLRDTLIECARRGVKVVLLVDAWGTGSSYNFFQPLINAGGQVRIFNIIKFARLGTRFLTQSHRRNHRKIIVIDNKIAYIGSSNITNYNLTWRELVVKMRGTIAYPLKHIVETDFKYFQRYSYIQRRFTRTIHFHGFEIIRDVPSIIKQKVMRKCLFLIRQAKEEIYIETPYFLPGFRFRKAIIDAAQRGVKVKIVMPKHSDVAIADMLRNKYLGSYFKAGVEILFYQPHNLHSKLMIVDNTVFMFGSSNFDYRSFRYMHEIMLLGKDKKILEKLMEYRKNTLNNVTPFNYLEWEKRSIVERIVTTLLLPFRYLF